MTNQPRKSNVRPIRPKTVTQAAASGDERALLTALRDVLARAITDGPPPRDLAALTRRLMEVSRELAIVSARAEVSEPSDGGFDPNTI